MAPQATVLSQFFQSECVDNEQFQIGRLPLLFNPRRENIWKELGSNSGPLAPHVTTLTTRPRLLRCNFRYDASARWILKVHLFTRKRGFASKSEKSFKISKFSRILDRHRFRSRQGDVSFPLNPPPIRYHDDVIILRKKNFLLNLHPGEKKRKR